MLFDPGPDGAALALLTLGVVDDDPPLPELQPPLLGGIHLRWAFSRDRTNTTDPTKNLGFPWYGFYMFRRLTPTTGATTCAAAQFSGLTPGPRSSTDLQIPLGLFHSDQNLVLTDEFPAAGTIEIDLSGRQFVDFQMDRTLPSSRVDVKIGFVADFPPPSGGGGTGPGPGNGSGGGLGGATGSNANCGCGCEHAALVPIVERVVLVAPGQYRATFGYENVGTTPVSMPVGPENRFFPDPADRGQPTLLLPGRRIDAFSVIFDGRLLSWRLAGHTVTVSAADATTGSSGGTGGSGTGGGGNSTDGIQIKVFRNDIQVATRVVSGRANEVVSVSIPADAMDEVRVGSGPARLIDICAVRTTVGNGQGWAPVPNLTQPITLPVRTNLYPARQGTENRPESEAEAISRISYAFRLPNDEFDTSEWQGQGFDALYAAMLAIVREGPINGITDHFENVTADLDPKDPNATRPVIAQQSSLDLLLAGSLHPPIAQMLGLYAVDRTAVEGQSYDYALVGDYFNAGAGNINTIQALLTAENYTNIHVFIKRGAVRAATPALAAPAKVVPPSTDGFQGYALPLYSNPPGAPADAAGVVGLRWTLTTSPNQKLPPTGAFLFHLWRKSHGRTLPADDGSFAATGFSRVTAFPLAPREPKPTDPPVDPLVGWPATRIFATDGPLVEGWYSYRVSGIDLFGRHSARSDIAPELKALDRTLENGRAVHIIDKVPPPAPNRVQATLLDPKDQFLFKDQAYNDWRSQPGNASVIGLRVRWLWGASQRLQAPDTKEFRIYINPGSSLAEPTDAMSWSQRIAIVGVGERIVPQSLQPLKNQSNQNVLGQSVAITGPEVELLDGPSLLGLVADQVELQLVSNSVAFQFPVLGIDSGTRMITVDRPIDLPSVQSWALLPSRAYEVFLPATSLAVPPAFTPPTEPPAANPIAYSLVGVSAADDKDRDDLRTTAPLADRDGNEGLVGGPATVVLIRSTPPDPPPAPFDDDFLPATRADFLSRSFFMLHAVKQLGPTAYAVNVYRALDETLFQVDFKKRPAGGASPPSEVSLTALGWSAAKRNAAASEFGTLTSIGAYANLSFNALRLLASLPSNVSAFVKLNEAPLPSDTSDARGLSDPPAYRPEDHPTYLAYLDTLDGRATNRYFYRTTLLDSAQNESDLRLCVSTPAVVLPVTAVPVGPRLLGAVGADGSIGLSLLAVTDPAVTTYRIYRATTAQAANDIRLMDLHATITDSRTVDLRSQPLPITDQTAVVPYQDYFYRATAVLTGGVDSPASDVMTARAFDGSPPPEPTWERTQWVKLDAGGGEHAFSETDPDLVPALAVRFSYSSRTVARALVQSLGDRATAVSGWLTPVLTGSTATFSVYIQTLSPSFAVTLRARAVTRGGLEGLSQPRNVAAP